MSSKFSEIKTILESHPIYGVPPEPSEFSNRIYIGTKKNAESAPTLKRYQFTHVLNCDGIPAIRPDRERRFAEYSSNLDKPIVYDEIYTEDNDFFEISRHFARVFTLLDRVSKVGRMLIYSDDVNTSGVMAIGYLVYRGMSLEEAVKKLKFQRNAVLFNVGFMRQLVRFVEERRQVRKTGGCKSEMGDDLLLDAKTLRKQLRNYELKLF